MTAFGAKRTLENACPRPELDENLQGIPYQDPDFAADSIGCSGKQPLFLPLLPGPPYNCKALFCVRINKRLTRAVTGAVGTSPSSPERIVVQNPGILHDPVLDIVLGYDEEITFQRHQLAEWHLAGIRLIRYPSGSCRSPRHASQRNPG